LVVDDSAFARSMIIKRLDSDPDLEVVGFAKDGLDAVEQVRKLNPDVVTLDVTMPNLDGLGALERIMAECPTPVVMLSALTGEQTHATIKALELGAVDFFLKPAVASPAGTDTSTLELIEKVKIAARITRDRLGPGKSNVSKTASKRNKREVQPGENQEKPGLVAPLQNVLVIGASTGGPRALTELIPQLPASLPAAVLIVQHMPAGFTDSFSERLNQLSDLDVKEAAKGDQLKTGQVLLAPGGYHMKVNGNGQIVLDKSPAVCGVRPSVDVTMESVVRTYGPITKGLVLTGMGSDGTFGSSLIKTVGGQITVEAESTCAVYGMPRSVVEKGYADVILPLNKIAEEICRICRFRSTKKREVPA
jgi:two-component system chemotaxis response regulator CheB